MKRILSLSLLALLPLTANAITLVTDPIDSRATHCGIFQDGIRIASSPVLPTAPGNICSYKLTNELSSFGAHFFTATAQVIDSTGAIKVESARSNRISVTVTLDAPTNLTAQ